MVLGVLWPGHTKQRQHRIDIAMFADGRLHVNGEPSRLSDLEGLLAVQPVQFATVDAEGDVTMGALDEMQKLLVKHGIPRARLLRLERGRTGFGQAPRRHAP